VKFFIGEVHNFIGDNLILLAEKIFYWRNQPTYWRKSKFIGELEIPSVFFQSRSYEIRDLALPLHIKKAGSTLPASYSFIPY
jgi:hypothetical protein